MSKRKTIWDHSKLLVAPLLRLETEIQEAMLLSWDKSSNEIYQDTLFPENHSSALHKVIHESVEEESVWLGYSLVGSIKEGVN
jgi:hypothetical protein